MLHSIPEVFETREPIFLGVAGNQARINRADRSSDDPIRLDPCLVQRLIHSGLIGAECSTTLQN